MPKHDAKIRPLDELENEIVRTVRNTEIQHSRDVSVMKQRRQPGLAEEHLDELCVVRERREDAFETYLVLEAILTTPQRDERLSHTPDTESSYELVVSERLEGRPRHRRVKLPQLAANRGTELMPGRLEGLRYTT